MKLRTLSTQIHGFARQLIGGKFMVLEIGERVGTLKPLEQLSSAARYTERTSWNCEDFLVEADGHDDSDLHETYGRGTWKDFIVPQNAELDFYVYAAAGGGFNDRELKDNLGILIRDWKIVGYRCVGDRSWRNLAATTK